MMEWYDGVRVYWNGIALFDSKTGQRIYLPKDWQAFPKFAFEGVLWMGLNKKKECVELIKTRSGNWKDVKIIAFDAPQDSTLTYQERYQQLVQGIVTFISDS